MYKIIQNILVLALFSALAYAFRGQLGRVFDRAIAQYFPCYQPLGYAVGSFDARFGISRDDFMHAIREAESVWERPVGKQLFVVSPDGDLQINLIYDYRQEATAKLQKLGLVVNDDQSSYNALKAKYDALQADYTGQKALFESRVAAFRTRKDAYEEKVALWNGKGGAPQNIYEQLMREKEDLNSQFQEIDRMQNRLNAIVDNINALALSLNRLSSSLNLNVARFNQIGDERGGEFEEGLYRSSAAGQEIDIYQFDNYQKLVRVLAHELGHALGLEHLEDPKAIMYRLNQATNEKLASSDLDALKKLCRIK